jgi:hypothetical protein
MPRKKVEGDRYFVRLTKEQKRRLDHLSVEAGALSTEEYGGRLLAKAIDRLWEKFDPKQAAPPKAAGK